MAIKAAKRQAVVAIRYAVLAIADFATPFGDIGEPNGIKDLKTVKSGDQKTKGRPLPLKNVSPLLLREFR
jgi:hypothetical protein